jgi:putative transposase
VLTDRRGAPLAVTITGANCHDVKVALPTIDGIVVPRPEPEPYRPQHLCLDKGYDSAEIEAGARERQYRPYIRRRGEEAFDPSTGRRRPARRWVVERTGSWHNRFRKLLIRWQKKAQNYLALVQLACTLIVYRRTVLG